MTDAKTAPTTCPNWGENEVVRVLRGLPLPYSRIPDGVVLGGGAVDGSDAQWRACDRRFAGGRPVPIDPGR